MTAQKRIAVFDTTLRDGQQCPGAGMSFEKNLEYARLAHLVGIDVLEAGFPCASKLDFEIVLAISEELGPLEGAPTVAALCQLRDEQIDQTIEALQPAVSHKRARLHTYLPVDPNLMEASLGSAAEDKPKLVRHVHDFCKRAVDAGLEVEFSPEGYSRMGKNFDFVTDLIRAALQAGALVINCPDTIGGASRYQGPDYFVSLLNRHAEIMQNEFPGQEIVWSAHCHNDFGLAVANTVAAVFEGPCTQIEGCFNGIGERAGNAALEQCIMVLQHFSECPGVTKECTTGIRTEKIQQISDFVANNMLVRQPHWPISGKNAARHSSGGHTNAVLNNPLVYQPFNPKVTGQTISLVFGPLSGGNHARSIIETFGYRCDDSEKAAIAQFLKDRYKERRKGITDEELLDGYFDYRRPIAIEEFDYWRTKDTAELSMSGRFFDQEGEIRESNEGKDSALATLKKLIDSKYDGLQIESYNSESVGSGIHAMSLSTIVVSDPSGHLYEGKAEDQDIGKSAMKALIKAVNLAYIEVHYRLSSEG